MPTKSKLGDLPREILLEVFSYLPTGNDLVNIAKVNNLFWSLVKQPQFSNKLWRYQVKVNVFANFRNMDGLSRSKWVIVSYVLLTVAHWLLAAGLSVYRANRMPEATATGLNVQF